MTGRWSWVIGAVLITFSLGCPPKPPNPVDVCPNLEGVQLSVPDGYELVNGQCVPITPPGPLFLDMLLRRDGSRFIVNGQPIDIAGCIHCCMPLDAKGRRLAAPLSGINVGWPLISDAGIDYCQAKGSSNAFHVRPGPFLSVDEPLSEAGGSYAEVNGKADLTKLNQAFLSNLEARITYAGNHHAWVEVDLIDTWRLKGQCEWSPWNQARNIQGEDHCGIKPGDAVAQSWLKSIVQTTSRFGNVIYQIGNESSGVEGKTQNLKTWEKWVYDTVRQYEGGVDHLIGTNSGFDEIESSFPDYIEHHDLVYSPLYDRPTSINEINPAPTSYLAEWCRMHQGGTYLWVWRAGLSQADWDKALADVHNAIVNGCQTPPADQCPDPKPNPAELKWNAGPSWGGFYDATPLVTKDCAYCTATDQGDGGTRCTCPARMECPGFQCEYRVPCEQVLMQSYRPVWKGDGHVTFDSGGWRAKCDDCTTLTVCNGPQTICAKVF